MLESVGCVSNLSMHLRQDIPIPLRTIRTDNSQCDEFGAAVGLG